MGLTRGKFIDLFAGCGGLSLGLMAANWQGLFAVEQDSLAFETLKFNLLESKHSSAPQYHWPHWLPAGPIEISRFIKEYHGSVGRLNGAVDLIAGGPPCQGFSMAGRRKSNDPRNELFKHYVNLVSIVEPSFLLLENVKGISVAFSKQSQHLVTGNAQPRAFSERITEDLENVGYRVFTRLIRAVDLGVPQFRPRFIMLAIRNDLIGTTEAFDPFSDFAKQRTAFLQHKGLSIDQPVTVRQAISDLETTDADLVDCVDSPGFQQIRYSRPRTKYQRLLHGDLNGTAPNSLRLARHRDETRKRFKEIMRTCRQGVSLSDADRERFGLRKHCIVPLDAEEPSHTLTTLPDDFLHYSEPRILTVREYARLQSFPDWYEFRGKYTTGGNRRLKECPRYTQAGNAVPPFLAEFLGRILKDVASNLCVPLAAVDSNGRQAK